MSARSATLAGDAQSLVRTFEPFWLGGATACVVSLAELSALLDGLPLPGLPHELARAVRSRQLSFLAGRLCAEQALAQLGMRGAMVARGNAGEPIWPSGWTGSISHSPDEAIAVVSTRRSQFDLGIDVEHVVGRDMVDQLTRTCLLPTEIATHVSDDDKACMNVTALFSIKEAYFKSIHRVVQRHVDFMEVQVSQLSLRSGIFVVGASDMALTPHAMPSMAGRIQLRGHVVTTWVFPGQGTPLGSFTYMGNDEGVN